ncbi:hypothetical protein, partial [Streptomyces hygroscopicus]|uniref:hypothetical protein n=1 Tax=Streptomyces hygroscopicus TaxID=1912 RepID=UPI0036939E4D
PLSASLDHLELHSDFSRQRLLCIRDWCEEIAVLRTAWLIAAAQQLKDGALRAPLASRRGRVAQAVNSFELRDL